MSHPYHHARSSARKFGGEPEDYLAIHQWFDQTKAHVADARHRLVLHNSFGIFLAEQVFGPTIDIPVRYEVGEGREGYAESRKVPTRLVAEQHVLEDFGKIPTLVECLETMELEPWMFRSSARLSETDQAKPVEDRGSEKLSEAEDAETTEINVNGTPHRIQITGVID